MREEKYYWLKSNGEVTEIDRKQFLELDYQNATNKNKHSLVWKVNDALNFIEIGNWVSIEAIKKIIN